MNISTFVFSPTHTTASVVKAMTSQFKNAKIIETDWTHSENTELTVETDLVIIGVPVYAGLVPTTVLERVQNLKGDETPIVLVAVYGNRSAEAATRELFEMTSKNGFISIAAAEFIGEHSFSTPTYPIAANRPDTKDLQIAQEFGQKIMNLLDKETEGLRLEDFDQSPHRERNPMKLDPPAKNLDKCTNCGKCIPVCPQNIWPLGNSKKRGECIGCCACIKVCEDDALSYQDVVHGYAVKLNELCQDRKEPKLIIPQEF